MKEKPRSAGQVLLIPIGEIVPNPNQPRKVFDQSELVNLAISIRMNGMLQPITVRETLGGYELVSGERRLRASKLAGMQNVPCIVVDVSSMKSAVFALIENLQRQNLAFFEEAEAISKLMKDFALSQEETARRLGKAPSTVSNKLRLLTLPEDVRLKITESGLTERHARALLPLKEQDLYSVLEKVIDKKLTVTATEALVEEQLRKDASPKRQTKLMFSDVKIFLNTIEGAFATMNKAGIKAKLKKEDKADSFVYVIEIPKNEMYKRIHIEQNKAN